MKKIVVVIIKMIMTTGMITSVKMVITQMRLMMMMMTMTVTVGTMMVMLMMINVTIGMMIMTMIMMKVKIMVMRANLTIIMMLKMMISPAVCSSSISPASPFLCLDIIYLCVMLEDLGFPPHKTLKVSRLAAGYAPGPAPLV